jgi:hypothetical protein
LATRALQSFYELIGCHHRVLAVVAYQKMFFDLGDERLRKTMESVFFEDFITRVGREASIRVQRVSHNGASNKSYVSM